MDSLGIEVDCRDAGSFALTAGNLLGDALMWLGRVVVNLVLGQDGAQVRLAQDQHTVEELAAQGADEALTGRVHPGSLRRVSVSPTTIGSITKSVLVLAQFEHKMIS
jgi:hypothetical protein